MPSTRAYFYFEQLSHAHLFWPALNRSCATRGGSVHNGICKTTEGRLKAFCDRRDGW